MYSKILIPIDGSACSDQAVAEGARLAKLLGSSVTLLYAMNANAIVRDSPYDADTVMRDLRQEAAALVAPSQKIAAAAGVDADVMIADGEPIEEIARRSEGFDLLVIGSHGKGVVKRALMGSVAQAILHRVVRPVLVVRCASAG